MESNAWACLLLCCLVGKSIATCGDGILSEITDEECDDGNLLFLDGCSERCKIESGWSCFNNPSYCTYINLPLYFNRGLLSMFTSVTPRWNETWGYGGEGLVAYGNVSAGLFRAQLLLNLSDAHDDDVLLKFATAYEIEPAADLKCADGAQIRLFNNMLLYPMYINYTGIVDNGWNNPIGNQPAICGYSNWTVLSFNLTAFKGTEIELNFDLAVDIGDLGTTNPDAWDISIASKWYVDQIYILQVPKPGSSSSTGPLDDGGSGTSSPASDSEESPQRLAYMAGGIAGGAAVLIAVVIAVTVVIVKRKKNNKAKTAAPNLELQNYTSMGSATPLIPATTPQPTPNYFPTPNYIPTANYIPMHSPKSSMREESTPTFAKTKDKYSISYSELQFLNEIGRGAFGIVYRGRWRASDVAIKMLNTGMMSQTAIDDILKEADLMKNMRPHKNVVAFLGVSREGGNPICLVTEFLNNGSLVSLLRNNTKTLSIPFCLRIITDIAAGMYHLQLEKIVHKDLAARNILLDSNNCAKVSDFGLSRISDSADNEVHSKSDFGPIKWMPLESVNNRMFSVKSDVWSFGITCLEILTRTQPFPSLDNLHYVAKFLSNQIDPMNELPDFTPPRLRELLALCWHKDPSKRPDFEEICGFLGTIKI